MRGDPRKILLKFARVIGHQMFILTAAFYHPFLDSFARRAPLSTTPMSALGTVALLPNQ
jgi:hypothetical protein